MHTLRRLLSALLLTVAATAAADAQEAPYRFDIGADLGMSGYIGEAASPVCAHPGFTADLSMRYIPNVRMAFRGMLSVQGLSGTTDALADALPAGMEPVSFTATAYALDLRYEFNFLPYGIGETYKRLRRFTPYLTIGLGLGISSSGGHTAVAPLLPMGLGVRYKLGKRLNLNAEFTLTKSFSDKFDGPALNDLNQIKTEFYKNTDWYSRLTIGISYEFGERCATCHYVD